MATAASVSVNVTNTGVSVMVPNDDIARVMYYLNCVTVGLGLDLLQDDLVDFRNYSRLSLLRIALVLKTALEFGPDEFIDKLIFRDDEGEIVNGSSGNEFCDISVACGLVSLQQDVLIAGKVQNVTKVMFFKSSWLETFYTGPIARAALLFSGTQHCAHCKGEDGLCACTDCPRSTESQCQPLVNVLIDALSGTHISSRSTSPAPPAPVRSPNAHACNCDGCRWEWLEGTRYRCTVCNDYDLCDKCYANNHHDLSHPFWRIDRPGSTPIQLDPRSPTAHACICDGCRKQYFEGTRYRCTVCADFDLCWTCYAGNLHDLSHAFSQIDRPKSSPILLAPRARPVTPTPRPPLPPRRTGGTNCPAAPPTSEPPPPYAMATATSPFFYHEMPTSELKKYLFDRDVGCGDVLDRETLCRRVWEAHCDCMSVRELTAFLSENGISVADCRDIASRRERAKGAFEARRPAPPTPTPVAVPVMVVPEIRVQEHDVVTLTGLNRADMNGKRATVVQADCGGGRAEVRLEESGKLFKVKFANLAVEVNEDFLD